MTTTINTQSKLDAKIKEVCDVLRSANCAGALQYVPELTWLLFLRFLDERETFEERDARIQGTPFTPALDGRYRWSSWAAPSGEHRQKLQRGARGDVRNFLRNDLLPLLHELGSGDGATPRQRLISQIVADVNDTRVDTEGNFLDVIDLIDEIRLGEIDDQHLFALSAVYEGLLLSMGEKNNDGGQFYTPRAVVRAMVRAVDPKLDDLVYDPCCGTGGFLAQSYEHMRGALGSEPPATDLQQLSEDTFYGREKDNLAYPIALANLVLHGIDFPHIWHGNTLTKNASDTALFDGALEQFDVILTNPPFGGKEGDDAQSRFVYRSRETQLLFLQDVIDSLRHGGQAGMVIDEGTLFKSTKAHRQIRQKLLEECDLYCIVSLATGAFIDAGTGVKTDLLFFKKGVPTENVWYYEVAPPADAPGAGGTGNQRTFNKSYPLRLEHFDHFFDLLPTRKDSENSWTVTIEEIKARNYDLKATNPNRIEQTDTRTPTDLLAEIEHQNTTLTTALTNLRKTLNP